MLDAAVLVLRGENGADQLLRCLRTQVDRVTVAAEGQELGARKILARDAEEVSDQALRAEDAIACDVEQDSVHGPAILDEIPSTAEKDVRADLSSLSESPSEARIERGVIDIVGRDNEDVPIALLLRIAPCAATEQPDLRGSDLVHDFDEEVRDRLQVNGLAVAVLGRATESAAQLWCRPGCVDTHAPRITRRTAPRCEADRIANSSLPHGCRLARRERRRRP